MNLAETAELSARLSLDTSNFDRGVGRAIGGLSRFQAAMGRVGTGVGQLARGGFRVLERGLLALSAAMVYGAKQAIDFEDAFAGVARTLSDDTTPAQLEKIRKGILALALKLPLTQVELANIAETAGTVGIASSDIVAFTEAIARLAKVTDLSVGTVTPTIAKLMKVLHIGTSEINNFFSGLAQASIIAPATDQEMILAAERFASLAQQIGFTRDQIIALATVSVTFGQRPEAAGTAVLLVMQRTVRNLAMGGDKLKLFAKISGETVAAVKKQWATAPFEGLISFLEGFGKLSAGQQALVSKQLGFSTARIGQLLANLALNIPALKDYNTQITKADKEGRVFLELSDKRFTTTRNHLIILWNNVKDLGIAFGEGLGIDKATGALDRFVARLIEFLQTNRAGIKQLGAEVGRFLDNISFAGLRDDATKVINFLHNIGDLIKLIPKDWLYIGAALVGLNKLSGGLLALGTTNIFGGLLSGIGALVTKIVTYPIVKSLIPQPVIVMAFSPLAQAQMGLAGVGGAVAAAEAAAAVVGTAVFGSLSALLKFLGIIVLFATGAVTTSSTAPGATNAAMTPQQYLTDLLKMQAAGRGAELVDFSGKTVNDAIEELRAQGIVPLIEAVKQTHQEALDATERQSNIIRGNAAYAKFQADTWGNKYLAKLEAIRKATEALKPLPPLIPAVMKGVGDPRKLLSSAALLDLAKIKPGDPQEVARILRALAVPSLGRTHIPAKTLPALENLGVLLEAALKAGDQPLINALTTGINDLEASTGVHLKSLDAKLALLTTVNATISGVTKAVGSVVAALSHLRLPTPRVNIRFGNPINRTTVTVSIGARTVTRAIYSGGGYGPAYVYGGAALYETNPGN